MESAPIPDIILGEMVLNGVRKSCTFSRGWMLIMTVLLNRPMQRSVLLKPRVPSLSELNAFVFIGTEEWAQDVGQHCKVNDKDVFNEKLYIDGLPYSWPPHKHGLICILVAFKT